MMFGVQSIRSNLQDLDTIYPKTTTTTNTNAKLNVELCYQHQRDTHKQFGFQLHHDPNDANKHALVNSALQFSSCATATTTAAAEQNDDEDFALLNNVEAMLHKPGAEFWSFARNADGAQRNGLVDCVYAAPYMLSVQSQEATTSVVRTRRCGAHPSSTSSTFAAHIPLDDDEMFVLCPMLMVEGPMHPPALALLVTEPITTIGVSLAEASTKSWASIMPCQKSAAKLHELHDPTGVGYHPAPRTTWGLCAGEHNLASFKTQTEHTPVRDMLLETKFVELVLDPGDVLFLQPGVLCVLHAGSVVVQEMYPVPTPRLLSLGQKDDDHTDKNEQVDAMYRAVRDMLLHPQPFVIKMYDATNTTTTTTNNKKSVCYMPRKVKELRLLVLTLSRLVNTPLAMAPPGQFASITLAREYTLELAANPSKYMSCYCAFVGSLLSYSFSCSKEEEPRRKRRKVDDNKKTKHPDQLVAYWTGAMKELAVRQRNEQLLQKYKAIQQSEQPDLLLPKDEDVMMVGLGQMLGAAELQYIERDTVKYDSVLRSALAYLLERQVGRPQVSSVIMPLLMRFARQHHAACFGHRHLHNGDVFSAAFSTLSPADLSLQHVEDARQVLVDALRNVDMVLDVLRNSAPALDDAHDTSMRVRDTLQQVVAENGGPPLFSFGEEQEQEQEEQEEQQRRDAVQLDDAPVAEVVCRALGLERFRNPLLLSQRDVCALASTHVMVNTARQHHLYDGPMVDDDYHD